MATKAAAIRRCHSHQEACQVRPIGVTARASPRRTRARVTAVNMRTPTRARCSAKSRRAANANSRLPAAPRPEHEAVLGCLVGRVGEEPGLRDDGRRPRRRRTATPRRPDAPRCRRRSRHVGRPGASARGIGAGGSPLHRRDGVGRWPRVIAGRDRPEVAARRRQVSAAADVLDALLAGGDPRHHRRGAARRPARSGAPCPWPGAPCSAGRPPSLSATHSSAKRPSWISSRILRISAFTASVMMRGPRVRSPYSAVSEIE